MPKENKDKPKYEAPVLLPLGELARGEGECQNGTGPLTGSCREGTNGFASCGPGPSAKSDCGTGTLPGTSCTQGGDGQPNPLP